MHVVVMGAGVVGVTTAWQLLEDGHEVTVLDRQPEAACETSFANAGLVAFRDGRVVGFLPARELPDLWPGDKAMLLVMPLDGPPV